MPMPICQLISTGGTIAMKIDQVTGAVVPVLSGEDLAASIPAMAEVAQLDVLNLSNVPSDYMCPERWITLQQSVEAALARDDVCGVVISHGTDTLEETAWFLDLTVRASKPVVLTGAQRNASSPDFDGPRNLLHAVRVCIDPRSPGMGAMIVMNNQINSAREVTKSHTSDVESFKSGDFGFLGVVDEDRVVFSRKSTRRQHIALECAALPRVEIIPMFAGASGDMVRAAAAVGARGIIIQALGFGNVNEALHDAVAAVIAEGISVVISTRVPNGRVVPVYGFKGGGSTLKALGAVFADNLSPQKARIVLMLALQQSRSAAQLQEIFDY